MSILIEKAKEVLTPEKVTRLELLERKDDAFEISDEEDNELSELKKEVKRLIANRDKQKNLAFLKDGNYSITDILQAMGKNHQQALKESGLSLVDVLQALEVTKKQVTQAAQQLFQGGSSVKEPSFTGVLATFGTMDLRLTERTPRDINKHIQQHGEKEFVKNLTDSGREWLVQSYISEKGPFKGKQIYKNISDIALKFKLDKEKLKKELGLGGEPPKKGQDKKAA